jgi:hypothetical protein
MWFALGDRGLWRGFFQFTINLFDKKLTGGLTMDYFSGGASNTVRAATAPKEADFLCLNFSFGSGLIQYSKGKYARRSLSGY